MLSKEEIEKAKERISKSLEDVWFGTLYSQEENDEDKKILLQYIQELETSNAELDKENNRLEKIEFERDKQNKIIDEMVKEINSGMLDKIDWCKLYNKGICGCDDTCLKCLKQYFEKKVEEN